ncbi:MAG: DUF1161 domain-containing protein [Campylobacteraceae bacterium]|jgi:hypothetical protein|nr:DUF1161 domain-containing protein [Campylobacteraceae bacterium]
MKKISLVLACILFESATLYATPCEEVMQMIAEKIKANGVKEFTLEAIDKGSSTDKKIVGVCGEGTKDIAYQRGKPTGEVSGNAILVVSPSQETKVDEISESE